MSITTRIPLILALLLLLALGGAALADGVDDNIINNEYGATRAIDGAGNDDPNGDSEACSIPDGNRGNLMELHAYNKPTTNEWYFAFVVDSSQPLNSTTGDFFGKGDSMQVNYILGIDVGCNGGPASDMNAGTPWRRFFSWQGATFNGGNPGVDYFVAMYPTGADTMNAQLYSMSGSTKSLLVSDFPVTSRVVDFRRHVEFSLASSLGGLPADLQTNGQLCLALITTENSDGGDFNGGKVIDDLGAGGSVTGCDTRYRLDNQGGNGPMPEKIDTQLNCQNSGRPLPGGSPTRHCTSFPARQAVNALDSGNVCLSGPIGVNLDGNIEGQYTLLTEARFAGPYQGGDPNHSDFGGESSAYSYWDGSAMQIYAGFGNADVRDVHAQTDGYFLYVNVSGPGLTAFGGAGQMNGQPPDEANLFIAIDIPEVDSGTDTGDHGGGPEVYTPPNAPAGVDAPNHPGSRPINFRGWDPDYIVEMIWAGDDGTVGNAQLWRWDGANWVVVGSFTTVETTGTSPSGSLPFNTAWHTISNPPAAGALYFGRQPTSYEFAIPWLALGLTPGNPHPAAEQDIKLGVYTTRNPDGWDINDQAPGIGQGANGLGSHERLGDLPDENDNETDPGAAGNDLTPYVGRTHGQGGRNPGSDNTEGDSDTIESYFVFNVDPDTIGCTPSVVALRDLTGGGSGAQLPGVAAITAVFLLGVGLIVGRRRAG